MTKYRKALIIAFLLAISWISTLEAACPEVACQTYFGFLGDECICVRTGLVDYNGGFTRCQVWTRTRWVTIEHGFPPIPIEICGCDFSAPCTHGPV